MITRRDLKRLRGFGVAVVVSAGLCVGGLSVARVAGAPAANGRASRVPEFLSAAPLAPNKLFAVARVTAADGATSNGLFVSNDGGSSWVQKPWNLNVAPVALGDGSVLLSTGGKDAVRSLDGGASWQPASIPEGEYHQDLLPDPADPDTAWECNSDLASPTFAGLYVTHDAGGTWRRVHAPTTASCNGLGISPGGHVLLLQGQRVLRRRPNGSGSESDIEQYRSTDDGVHWKRVSKTLTVSGAYVFDLNKPNIVMARASNRRYSDFIARSSNAGRTWTRLRGLRVGDVMTGGANVTFGGNRFVVDQGTHLTRNRDGFYRRFLVSSDDGRSWQRLTGPTIKPASNWRSGPYAGASIGLPYTVFAPSADGLWRLDAGSKTWSLAAPFPQ